MPSKRICKKKRVKVWERSRVLGFQGSGCFGVEEISAKLPWKPPKETPRSQRSSEEAALCGVSSKYDARHGLGII